MPISYSSLSDFPLHDEHESTTHHYDILDRLEGAQKVYENEISTALFFKDEELDRYFTRYQESKFKATTVFPFLVAFAICAIVYLCLNFIDPDNVLTIVLCVFSFLLYVGVGGSLGFLYIMYPIPSIKQTHIMRLLENIFYIGCLVASAIILFIKIMNGNCYSVVFNAYVDCFSIHTLIGLPADPICFLLLTPVVFSCVLNTINWSVILVTYLLSVICVVTCVILASSWVSVSFVAILMLSTSIALYNVRRFYVQVFLGFVQTQILEDEKKLIRQEAAEYRAMEIRTVIANVAHDLKTPLTAFLCGIELVNDVRRKLKKREEELRKLVLDHPIPPEKSDKSTRRSIETSLDRTRMEIDALKSTVQGVINAHYVMQMTVNRCIDFNKSKQGIPLLPNNESVHLLDCLNSCIDCIRGLDCHVPVELLSTLPTDGSFCLDVVTDKQWLQDNVLCLLSNAVKFTASSGVVTLQVSLKKQIPNQQLCSFSSEDVLSPVRPRSATRAYPSFSIDTTTNASPDERSALLLTPALSPKDLNLAQLSRSHSYVFGESPGVESAHKWAISIEVLDEGPPSGLNDISSAFHMDVGNKKQTGGSGLGLYCLARRVEVFGGQCGVKPRGDGKVGSNVWFAIPYVKSKSNTGSFSSTVSSPHNRSPHMADLVAEALLGEPSIKDQTLLTQIDLLTTFREQELKSEGLNSPFNADLSEEIEGLQLRVLLVDDAMVVRKMAKLMLSKQGFQVHTAENGLEALRALFGPKNTEGLVRGMRMEDFDFGEIQQYDIVLMDLQMPVVDGFEAIEQVRAWESKNNMKQKHKGKGVAPLNTRSDSMNSTISIQTKGVWALERGLGKSNSFRDLVGRQVIIGMSANADHETMTHAFAAGADAFLTKPFDLRRFHAALRDLLPDYEDKDGVLREVLPSVDFVRKHGKS